MQIYCIANLILRLFNVENGKINFGNQSNDLSYFLQANIILILMSYFSCIYNILCVVCIVCIVLYYIEFIFSLNSFCSTLINDIDLADSLLTKMFFSISNLNILLLA